MKRKGTGGWKRAVTLCVDARIDYKDEPRTISAGPLKGQTMMVRVPKPTGPKGQPRTKVSVQDTSAGIVARLYTPTGAKEWKRQIRAAWEALKIAQPFAGPLKVDIVFSFHRPREHYKGHGRSAALREDAPYWHTNRPDRDNLDKCAFDALTLEGQAKPPRRRRKENDLGFERRKRAALAALKKLAWKDDCQICAGGTEKIYALAGRLPGMTLTISTWEG